MSLRNAPFRLTLIATALSTSLSAFAQQATDDKMQQVEVRASADAYNPRRDDTASKIVVNHDEIVKYGDTNVVDVLKRLPGITVTGGSARGGGEVRMRGLGAGYTQILLNGEAAPAGFSLDSLSPDVIERIEVLRAASAEFSTQSIAGTINIVLKKAIKKGQREAKLGVGGGQHFVNPTASLQLSDKVGAMSYSVALNAFYRKYEQHTPTIEDGFDANGPLLRTTESLDKGQFSAINLAPRLNWTLANGDTMTSQTFLNVNRYSGRDKATTVTTTGTLPAFQATELFNNNQNDFFRTDLNWVHKLASGAKLDLKVGGVVGGLGNQQRRLGYDKDGALVYDSTVISKGTDHGLTSTGKFSTPMFEGHALSIGWDGGVSTRADARLPEGLPDERYDARVNRLAAYAQDEWNVTPRWSVYFGGRWEGIRTRTAGNTFDTAQSTSSVWSPLFQTLYKLPGTKSDQVRFAVTRTYKAPNTQSLIPRRFESINNSETDPDFQGNPNLKPELALGLDASYEHYWGEGALLSASVSTRRIDNYTRTDVVRINERWVQMPINDGQAHVRSIELEAKFPLKSLVATAPALDLRGSVSRNWSSVDSVPGPDNRLNAQTPFSATLGVDYKAGALTTGGSFAFKTGGPVRIAENRTSYQTVRRDLEMYGLWKFDARHQLRVALANILAQGYVAETTFDGVRRRTDYAGPVVLRVTMESKF